MPFEGHFRDIHGSRSQKRIWCLNSVTLGFLHTDTTSTTDNIDGRYSYGVWEFQFKPISIFSFLVCCRLQRVPQLIGSNQSPRLGRRRRLQIKTNAGSKTILVCKGLQWESHGIWWKTQAGPYYTSNVHTHVVFRPTKTKTYVKRL